MDKPYYSLSDYLKKTYGKKIYKISVNAGLSCPNRDGTLSTKGCIFCSQGGSGDFADSIEASKDGQAVMDVKRQIDNGLKRFNKSVGDEFIIYFQAYTNTYGASTYLCKIWMEALGYEKVRGISIATRPDCLLDEIMKVLREVKKYADELGKFVWVELGLQTIHEDTARYIRREYKLAVYEAAVKKLREQNILFITHVIIGLPGEDAERLYETIDYLGLEVNRPFGIKLQLLHVLKNTDLAEEYEKGRVPVLSMEEYILLVAGCLERLPRDVVIHRLTGDGPKSILVAPVWSGNKKQVLNSLHRYLKENEINQGSLHEKAKNNT